MTLDNRVKREGERNARGQFFRDTQGTRMVAQKMTSAFLRSSGELARSLFRIMKRSPKCRQYAERKGCHIE